MCEFFSFCTEPEGHGGKRFYFDWQYRKEHLDDENDSHSLICKHFKLNEDICNKYEFNPLTKAFKVDQVNSPIDDRIQAEDWVNKLDFKRVVEPLIVKPIVNPFELPEVADVTPETIKLLKQWASVRASVRASVWASVRDSVWASVRASVWDSVRASVWASVWDSVWASVRDSVGASVRDSVGASVMASVWDSVWASVWASVRASVGDGVWDSVWDSVRDSVWAYITSFFGIEYKHDFSPCVTLWNMGIVPSFDGKTWRLHSGKNARVIYEISDDRLQETNG